MRQSFFFFFFFFFCLDNTVQILAKSKISRLSVASVAEQASLSLIWSQSKVFFCVLAQL